MGSDFIAEHNKKRAVIGAFAEKWTVLVIHALASGTRRYGELQRELGEITPKVLTETLRQLEYDGLVQRTVYAVVPPKVEYSLTALGRTFLEGLEGLCKWAVQHQTEVEEARLRFQGSQE